MSHADERRRRVRVRAVGAALVVGIALAGLGGSAHAQGGELPIPQPDPQPVRDRADEILRRPEFRASRPSLLERIIEWLADRLDDLLPDRLSGSGGVADAVAWVIVLAVIGWVAWLVLRSGWRRPRRAQPHGEPFAVEIVEHRDAAGWRFEAERLEAAGDHRGALRARHRELVAGLVELGLLADIPGRTAAEYRDELRTAAPERAEPFAAATTRFEAAWYANAPVGAGELAAFRELAARVLEGVPVA
jgi:hypothetical protein